MKRYCITGAPGCGKTSIIRALEMEGCYVVHEAATDVIAYEQMRGKSEPWLKPDFIDTIIKLQKQRQIQASESSSTLQFYDRSPFCTYALALYLGFEPSEALLEEIERIEKHGIYEKRLFFIENLGFCEPTAARRISFEESLCFERIHVDTYEKFGFELIHIPSLPLHKRVELLLKKMKS